MPFVDHIRTCREREQQVLIFHNRKGGFRLVRCAECGALYQCKKCHLPLASHAKALERYIVCPGCHEGAAMRCTNCQALRIKLSAPGDEIIEDTLQRLFPRDRVINIAREDHEGAAGFNDFDIILAARAAQRSIMLAPPTRLGLIGITLAEFGLAGHDYMSEEHVFQFLAPLAVWAQELALPVIAQAIDPTRPLFQALGSGAWDTWFARELDERKKFAYPPFTDLALVWYDDNKRDLDQGHKHIIDKLKTCTSVISILQAGKIERRHKKVPALLIKTKRGSTDWIKLLPATWKIDRNPDSIPTL